MAAVGLLSQRGSKVSSSYPTRSIARFQVKYMHSIGTISSTAREGDTGNVSFNCTTATGCGFQF
jgi:hypothetical protein